MMTIQMIQKITYSSQTATNKERITISIIDGKEKQQQSKMSLGTCYHNFASSCMHDGLYVFISTIVIYLKVRVVYA